MNVRMWLKALLLSAAIVSPVTAQDDEGSGGTEFTSSNCGECKMGTTCGSGDQHQVSGSGVLQGAHGFCLRCGGWGSCSCHGIGGCSGGTSLETAAIRTASRAMEKRDISVVIQVGQSLRDRVTFNRTRNALQLWSCDGTTLVASVNVQDPKLVTLAAHTLPDANRRYATVALQAATGRPATNVSVEKLIRDAALLIQQ